MADATTNPQTSSSQQIENKAELKDQTGTLTYSEEPCEVSADQIGEYLAIVPLENELDIVPVETGETVDGAEQAKAQTGEPQIVEDDVEAPSLEELKTALKEALIEQENDNDNDDVAAIEPAAGEDAQAQPQSQSDAQSVAEIEPEAGGEDNSANGITSSSRGYGFQSNFQAQGVIGLDDVGPIDPTALQYGVTQTEELLFIQEQKSLPDLNPHFIDTTTEHYIYEDDSVLANAIIKGESSNSTLTITISGIPSGWTCSDGAYDNSGNRVGDGSYDASTGIWTVTIGASLYYGGPILTPPADSDIDALSLTYSVVEADSITGQTGSDSIEFDVFVDAVADMPDVDGKDIVGNEGATLAINITGLTGEEVNNGAGNDDGSEDILHYYLFGALVGFTLSAGTETYAGSGVYMLDPSELANLTITPDDSNYSGSIDLVVTVSTSEIPVSDVDFDSSNDDAQALDVFTLKWIADADKPSLCVNDVEVKEDGAVFVPVSAQLADTDGSEYLTITVSGIPASWNLTGSGWMLVAGTTDTYEIMVSAGLDYADGFTVYPPADSDVDLNGITVTATATELSNGDTASVSDTISVYVDAVADMPNLATQNANGEEGTAIDLDITTSVNDTDGSEVIEFVKISNLPTGATLSAGTENSGVWTVATADLATLQINILDGTTGTFTLNVESVAYEQNTSGSETDLTDNRASAYDTIMLTVTEDDVPEIKDDTVKIDESDLAPTAYVSDVLTVGFGNDTPGDVSGNGSYDIGSSLTSEGRVVIVTYNGTTDTYTGVAGTEIIFTLVINSNGSYTFTLSGTLDHPDTTNPNDYLTLDFGVTATDSEGDTEDAEIHVKVYDDGPVAADDFGNFNASMGSYVGNALNNDTLSEDDDNSVTLISYGSNSAAVPDNGSSVRMDGTHGYLMINEDGDYTYTLYSAATGSAGVTTSSLSPVASDVAGIQSSITKDGITVAVANSGNYDISWVDTSDGSGLGIDNLNTNDSKKVWPIGEAFDISFAQEADTVTITIGELGSNNDSGNYGAECIIAFADSSTQSIEVQFVASEINNGYFTFTLDSDDYGSSDITSVELYSSHSGQYCGASFLLSDVEATHEIVPTVDEFTYTLTDGDGDTDTAIITFEAEPPNADLIVGQNVDDDQYSITSHLVNGNHGVIDGGDGTDILIGDAGGSTETPQTQDYNFVFILDFSGSMGSKNDANSRISLLKEAVNNLVTDMSAYQDGEIVIRIVPFESSTGPEATFTITDAGVLAQFEAYLDALSTGGYTNYEDPLQDAIAWLDTSSEVLGGNAITTTYFVSDGEPNKYIDDSGNIIYSYASTAMNEILGISDATNEVASLQTLSDDVIAVGINASSSMMDNLDKIDSDGVATNIDDPSDLSYVFASTNPIDTLNGAGDDVIQGGDGDDLIFGDVLYTDALANAHGLSTNDGVGWEVFERLENGESTVNSGWSREDTIDYIYAHSEELAQESTGSQGDGRVGGDDHLYGGAGDDTVFGQEGDDIIVGGEGEDMLYGGTGADAFVFESTNDGIDTVKDFDVSEGDTINLSSVLSTYDPVNDLITDFVMSTESNGDTHIYVDTTGSHDMSAAVQIAMLENVTGLDLTQAVSTDVIV